MKSKNFLFSLFYITTFLYGCSTEQLASTIEACKGDPNCYLIIDDAIKDELEARGISGGTMTNIELDLVENFLMGFTLGNNDNQVTRNALENFFTKSFYTGFGDDNPNVMNSMNDLIQDFFSENSRIVPNLNLFKVKELNIEGKQLFYTGESFNRVKHVLYKVGTNNFKYEIFGEEEFIFNLQIDLNSLFFRNKRYISPIALLEYFEDVSWSEVFPDQPYLYENEYFNSSINYFDDENAFTMIQEGYFYYEKGDELYSLDIPFFGLIKRFYQSSESFSFNLGFSGSYEKMEQFITITFYEFEDDWNEPPHKVEISISMTSNELDITKTLEKWLEHIEINLTYEIVVQVGKYENLNPFDYFKLNMAELLLLPISTKSIIY